MIRKLLNKITSKEDLTFSESFELMTEIMEGKINNTLLAAILIALKTKGESSGEVAGFAAAMRRKCVRINFFDVNTIDLCGTGGDNSNSFNISTASAFVVAGAGIPVAKHGNKSISSKCGSADVLDELGVNINLTAAETELALQKIGIAFLFAPLYHPAMKFAAEVRKELKTKTIFNLIGPLTNPAFVKKQLVGTFSNRAALLLAEAANYLDTDHALFICNNNSYDEILLTNKTLVYEHYRGKSVNEFYVDNNTLELPEAKLEDIKGGDKKTNAEIILNILKNPNSSAKLNTVVANSALALFAAEYSNDLLECKKAALNSLSSGAAYDKLIQLINFKK